MPDYMIKLSEKSVVRGGYFLTRQTLTRNRQKLVFV